MASATMKINLEPAKETLKVCIAILELWLNADRNREIFVKERYTDDGYEIYLELKEAK